MKLQNILELVVLVSVMWVPSRLVAVRGVPGWARLMLILALTIYVAVALSIAKFWPESLRPLTLLVLAGWLVAIWRARSSYGSRRHLPPGSLGLGSSIRALADYDFYAQQASRLGPVFKTNQYYRPVVCLVGLDRCQRFLRNYKDRLTSAPLSINRQISGGLLRYMEPELHRKYRKLLISCMTPQALRRAESFIEQRTREGLVAMATGGAASFSSGVPPYEHVDRLIYDVLTEVFFGISPEDDPQRLLPDLYQRIDHRRLWRGSSGTREAVGSIVALAQEQANKVSRQQGPQPSSFLAEAIHNDPRLMVDPIFMENLIYFLHIARCDLTGLCAWLLKMLLDHPEWAAQIRLDIDESVKESGDDTAADRFVRETLRLRQSEYLYRTTSDVVHFEGFSIPSGWLVRLCIRESHISDEVFERPREFDPDRFLETDFSLQQYQPFGIYEHACMGVGVTGTIGRIFVEQMATGFEWEITRDGPMELGLHHHGHWRPSSRLRMNLVEMGGESTPPAGG